MFRTIYCIVGNEISATCLHYAETPDVVSTVPVSPIAGWYNYPKSIRWLSIMHSLRQESSPPQRQISLKTSTIRKKASVD